MELVVALVVVTGHDHIFIVKNLYLSARPPSESFCLAPEWSMWALPDAGPTSWISCPVLIGQQSVSITQEFNRWPSAHAGSDQTVAENALVSLDGTASTDPDGDALSYSWSQLSVGRV